MLTATTLSDRRHGALGAAVPCPQPETSDSRSGVVEELMLGKQCRCASGQPFCTAVTDTWEGGVDTERRTSRDTLEVLNTERRTNRDALEVLNTERRTSRDALEVLNTERRTSRYPLEVLNTERRTSRDTLEVLNTDWRTSRDTLEGCADTARNGGPVETR